MRQMMQVMLAQREIGREDDGSARRFQVVDGKKGFAFIFMKVLIAH